jgi:hypothetical protein
VTGRSFILKQLFWLLTAALTAAACSPAPGGSQPAATYDARTGVLRTLTFDANRNGTTESTSYMEGTRILRIELDFDENGRVERWDFYRPDGSLEKVGLASRNDGVLDAEAFYESGGALARMRVSTRHDRVFDRTEFYAGGILTRSAEDTDRDGRPDKWETYRPRHDGPRNEPGYTITSTTFDDTGSGRPERRFVYGPAGTIARVELDLDGDGTFTPRRAGARTP